MKTILTMTVLLALGLSAQAQTTSAATQNNTSQVKASDLAPEQKSAQEEIDKEITNAKLRAEMGSKSRVSFKSAFSYYGGSVERPGAAIRPNYRAGAQVEELASLAGTIGVKYSLTMRDSLSLSTGVSILNPLNGDVSRSKFDDPRFKNTTINRYEVSTPSLSYTRAYKVGDLQMISGATYAHFTDSDTVNGMGGLGYVSLMQTIVAELGTSGWSAGAQLALYKYVWRGDVTDEFAAAGAKQTDYVYGVYPFAEYSFNDTFSFRTVFGYFDNIKYRGVGADGAVTSRPPYQSMGIGISVARDFYLYPNVQFTPLDIRSDRTNVGLTANINVF